MNILYRIFINNKQDAEGRNISIMDGYKPGDPLTCAYTATEGFPDMEPGDVCEFLYGRFNIEHPEDYHNRSLSVGDVVTLEYDDRTLAYAVDSFGFKEIEYPRLEAGSLVTADNSMENVMAAAMKRMGRKRLA
jgi:hypothetical protein